MTIWFDVTNSIEIWRGGIVGIIRVELMLIKKLQRVCNFLWAARVCNFLWAARSRLIDVGGDSVTK